MKPTFLLLGVILFFGVTSYSQNPITEWNFNTEPDGIEGYYRIVHGVVNQGLKLDGFTSLIREEPSKLSALRDSYTLEGWIALAAYPWNWCPILTQMKEETGGFSFEIGPRGELGLRQQVSKNTLVCISDEKIPLRKWTHFAAVFENGAGIRLYINGILVADYHTSGKPEFAPKEEIRMGMNYTAVFPSNRIGENGITPYWFSLDGILDELKVYNTALSEDRIHRICADLKDAASAKPEISPRHLPRVEETGAFEAYTTQLKYYQEWDQQWPVGPDPDIVVTFKDSPVKMIFWRGTRFSPAWVSDNNLWMCDQSVETWNDEEGCKEHMQDRHCRYSHVRIIENSPARKVIHWRYAPVSAYDTNWVANEKTGWEVWVDEYYFIYPDATGIRKVTWKTDYFGYPRQFQETLPLTEPGQLRKDVMEVDYLKVANLDGDYLQLYYTENPRKETEIRKINQPNIQQHNFKSAYDPFIIFEPGNEMHYISDRALSNLDYPGSCNHWPVGQAYCDGRVTQAADRPAHFLGFPISDPIIHDEKDGRSYWAGLYGMQNCSMDELVDLARSWAQAPPLLLESSGFSEASYHRDEKCYVVECLDPEQDFKCSISANPDSPVNNPAILIKNWGLQGGQVFLNGLSLQEGEDYEIGPIKRLEGSHLLLYLRVRTTEKIQISLLKN